ncbi:MAG: peptide chain release factor N(5)-glutamine methyltransferase [Bacilli bacterium]|nr:peptide chain release factor N(5)-glutamine methyltransferase [Bacilli bacterium]
MANLIQSLKLCLRKNKSASSQLNNTMATYDQVLREAKKAARNKRMETSAVELLMLEFSGLSPTELYISYKDEMPESTRVRFIEALDDYLEKKIPVQYIIGHVYFYGNKIKVDSNVLIPRYETEELVQRTLMLYDDHYDGKEIDVVDIGTGSGCIAIALKKEAPKMNLHAGDISTPALEIAKENASINDVEIDFRQGDLFEPFAGMRFDIIVSNPPYIPQTEAIDEIIHKNEPHVALFGGDDGLRFYRMILDNAEHHLKDKFIIAFEHGFDKGESLREYANTRFPDAKIFTERDMQGKERMTFIIRI